MFSRVVWLLCSLCWKVEILQRTPPKKVYSFHSGLVAQECDYLRDLDEAQPCATTLPEDSREVVVYSRHHSAICHFQLHLDSPIGFKVGNRVSSVTAFKASNMQHLHVVGPYSLVT